MWRVAAYWQKIFRIEMPHKVLAQLFGDVVKRPVLHIDDEGDIGLTMTASMRPLGLFRFSHSSNSAFQNEYPYFFSRYLARFRGACERSEFLRSPRLRIIRVRMVVNQEEAAATSHLQPAGKQSKRQIDVFEADKKRFIESATRLKCRDLENARSAEQERPDRRRRSGDRSSTAKAPPPATSNRFLSSIRTWRCPPKQSMFSGRDSGEAGTGTCSRAGRFPAVLSLSDPRQIRCRCPPT